MSTKLTVKQFSEINNLKGPEASQFLKVLEHGGVIKVVGKTKTAGERGRSAIVYDVDPDVLKNLNLKCPIDGVKTEITSA